MKRVVVDLKAYAGKKIQVRLVDENPGGWGHLNFDDFRFHATKPTFAQTTSSPLNANPILSQLVRNPAATSRGGAASETIKKMHLPAGFIAELIAAEPQVYQPIAFTFDARGRIWVVEGLSYPQKRPAGEGLDRILIFSDEDGDGQFESRNLFIEGLNLASGLEVGFGGVWVGAAPQLLFIPDRDQNDQPDSAPQVLLDGFGSQDTHETLNSFTWGPDGWLYGNQGVFNYSRIGKPDSSDDERVELRAGIWRYHPIRHQFEVFAHGGSNQWGLDFNEYGQLFMTHCRSRWGGGPTTHVIQGAHYWNQSNRNYADFVSGTAPAGYPFLRNYLLASARYGHGEGGAGKPGSRAVYGGHSMVGTMIYLGDNWPDSYRNHLFTHNLHGHQINHQVNRRDGSGYNTVHEGNDVFFCEDLRHIGVDLKYGPDGAVYTIDWHDQRLCHNPNVEQWDRTNGRIYRIAYAESFMPVRVNLAQLVDQALVKMLLHKNDWYVRTALRLLRERAVEEKISPAIRGELFSLAQNHPDTSRRLRGLWALHAVGGMDDRIAMQLLQDDSDYVRAWTIQLVTDDRQVS
ncbi:MAG: dehydrogenase, partial [Pirellulaceae bacterium]|nr:dehydrogenase [Pirellulaceae bacterium]